MKHLHKKCSALTSANKPCLRRAIILSAYCRVHQPKKFYD